MVAIGDSIGGLIGGDRWRDRWCIGARIGGWIRVSIGDHRCFDR